MSPDTSSSLDAFVKNIPHSRMEYPRMLYDRLKYFFWKLYTPYHPLVRDTALSIGIARHDRRQDFMLGRVAEGQSMEEFISFLIARGFKNHFVAWKDPGELVSLRYIDSFAYQYHLRVFRDGEVRGHYEYTPECHPIRHIREIGMEERRDVFLQFLEDRIT